MLAVCGDENGGDLTILTDDTVMLKLPAKGLDVGTVGKVCGFNLPLKPSLFKRSTTCCRIL